MFSMVCQMHNLLRAPGNTTLMANMAALSQSVKTTYFKMRASKVVGKMNTLRGKHASEHPCQLHRVIICGRVYHLPPASLFPLENTETWPYRWGSSSAELLEGLQDELEGLRPLVRKQSLHRNLGVIVLVHHDYQGQEELVPDWRTAWLKCSNPYRVVRA